MRRSFLFLIAAAATAAAAAIAYVQTARAIRFEADLLPRPHVLMPSGAPSGVVFLVSDAKGWQAEDQALAERLKGRGAAVVAIDLPSWLAKATAAVDPKDDDCTYLTADLEDLSHRIQRAGGASVYRLPVVAGRGAGGAVALGVVAQSPFATIGRTVVVDPQAAVPMKTVLCSQAPRKPEAGGVVYGLQPGPLPDPVDAIFTPAADAAGRDHVDQLVREGFALSVSAAGGSPLAALEAGIDRALAAVQAPAGNGDLSDLPIVEVPAKGHAGSGTMAIILSGDGGWRDLDRQIGDMLAAKGVPVIGLDSLKYFWSEKQPPQIAADLSRIIDHYAARWRAHQVILAGYSFGADAIPASYNRMKPEDKERIAEIALLAPSASADFVFEVTSWLSSFGLGGDDGVPTLPEIARIEPAKLQCFYGVDDDESICPQLKGKGIEIISTAGSHHFDGDYQRLADRILAGLAGRGTPARATSGAAASEGASETTAER
ncbi:virulence factor family protein [Prosthecomicrobium pneumaticum]|uniref:Type IV secretory pathway VirJ component n=1 Tax=Prosthecomicrobium pneumaticum TaxID=81895 RepID=A0A7W9FPN8_9HYPH|nr:virulence factor family protein [Prosthecomicrobium pneumaticum]MBB5754466.1 type IV secretory pathway VirJ component [Prosthecomicrobium pneumaticum]